MDKQLFFLRNEQVRRTLLERIKTIPLDQSKPVEVEVSPPKRTLSQNRKMWPLLKDISEQVVWFGEKYDEEDWKDLITALVSKSKNQKQRAAPGIDGGVVMFGQRTSKMKVSQMVEVIEAAYWFGTEHNVKFSDDAKREVEWANRFGGKGKVAA